MPAPPHARLKAWTEADYPAFQALHADADVAYWLGGAMDEARIRAAFDRIRAHMGAHGWGMWAVLDDDGAPVGAAGLQPTREGLPVAPSVEAAWRLRRSVWGRGYVTEVMRPILAHGFAAANLVEVLAYTAALNTRSQAVMERLGFSRDAAADFDHPALAAGHPLRRHIVYRMARSEAPPVEG